MERPASRGHNYNVFPTREGSDIDTGNFWEVSDLVLGKIEGNHYLENKEKQVKFFT